MEPLWGVPDGSGPDSGLSVLTRTESLEELVTLMRRFRWNAKQTAAILDISVRPSITPMPMSAAVGEGPFFSSG